MSAISELPEKTRNLIISIIIITSFVLVILAIVGANLARDPLPETILAPASSVSNQL